MTIINNILLLFVFIFLALTQCTFAIDKNIHIEKSDVGYDVYSANKELLLKFTKTNSDSSELALMKYIYDNQNEIDTVIQGEVNSKLIIVKSNTDDKWNKYVSIAQILGVLITATALIVTAVHYRKIIKIQAEQLRITLRPEFIPDETIPIIHSDSYDISFNIRNKGERACNVCLFRYTEKSNKRLLGDMGITFINDNASGINVDKDNIFTIKVNIKNGLSKVIAIYYGLMYADSIGNHYKLDIEIDTEGKINISKPVFFGDSHTYI